MLFNDDLEMILLTEAFCREDRDFITDEQCVDDLAKVFDV